MNGKYNDGYAIFVSKFLSNRSTADITTKINSTMDQTTYTTAFHFAAGTSKISTVPLKHSAFSN